MECCKNVCHAVVYSDGSADVFPYCMEKLNLFMDDSSIRMQFTDESKAKEAIEELFDLKSEDESVLLI
jgi:hypothetical protein